MPTKLIDTIAYNPIEEDISSSRQTLADFVCQLTGNEFAIKGLGVDK